MQVSRNELIAVVKQAFEGLGYAQGDYENAADTFVWSELHGLNGLQGLQRAVTDSTTAKKIKPGAYSLVSGARWNLAGASCFQVADLALGALRVQAQRNPDGIVSISLNDYRDPELIAKFISERINQNFAVAAIWFAEQGSRANVIRPDRNALNISYQQYTFSKTDFKKDQPLRLYAGVDAEAVNNRIALSLPEEAQLDVELGGAEMSESFTRQIANGIEIENGLWEKLISLGNNVLVEATEQSRLGAGA